MMDNLFSYSRIVSTDRAKKLRNKTRHISVKMQYRFRLWIVLAFIVTMVFTIFISSSLHLKWSKTKMTEEANAYRYQISSWVLEQKNILEMFTNTISAEPEKLDDYNGMVSWLDNITTHYSGSFLGVFAIDFYLNVLTDIINSNYT